MSSLAVAAVAVFAVAVASPFMHRDSRREEHHKRRVLSFSPHPSLLAPLPTTAAACAFAMRSPAREAAQQATDIAGSVAWSIVE